MSPRTRSKRACTYAILLPAGQRFDVPKLQQLGEYLSLLSHVGCEVIVFDASAHVETHQRYLRWMGRYVPVKDEGALLLDRAIELATNEKVIITTADARMNPDELLRICELLETHEVVVPQEYRDPLRWSGSIEAAYLLMKRAIGQLPERSSSFGFRKSVTKILRPLPGESEAVDGVQRLAAQGAEVFAALDLFVRRDPDPPRSWFRSRMERMQSTFEHPLDAGLLFTMIPLILTVGLCGGFALAGAVGVSLSAAAMMLAIRGRIGTGSHFPLHTVLFAPVSLLERSFSIYFALFVLLRSPGETSEQEAPESRRAAVGAE